MATNLDEPMPQWHVFFAIAVVASGGNTEKHVSLRTHNPAPAPAAAGPAGPMAANLDEPMPLKAAEQGFSGPDVQHKNKTTVTGDWRRAHGPKGPQPLQVQEPPAPPVKAGSVKAGVGLITLAVLSVTV